MAGASLSRRDSSLRLLAIVAMVLCTLPLVVYPFVLLANVMSLLATASPSAASGVSQLAAKSFLVTSTLYPAVWLGSVVGGIALLIKRRFEAAVAVVMVPLAYLGLVAILFWLWNAM